MKFWNLPSYMGIIMNHYKDPGLNNHFFMESIGFLNVAQVGDLNRHNPGDHWHPGVFRKHPKV